MKLSLRCWFLLSVVAVLTNFPLSSTQSTCSADSPCTEGCCSTYGSCGFGDAFCGAGNCTSNCDAKAQCGQYADLSNFNCPLNVCCSQYGFCGTTSDFCGTGCQTGCAKVNEPSCEGSSSDQRIIGYYESWSYERSCDAWKPETINPNLWTHINYAFALIDSSNQISAMNSYDIDLYPRVTALKSQNKALKVFIAVGGWTAGGATFSNMVKTSGSRSIFIESAISFMKTYGFDGIDIDWEYPAAADRDGVPADTENYVTFLKELRAACGTSFGISATLPSSYWYMQGFNIVGMEPYVDWFNFMSYDIHGTWDGVSPYTQAVVQPHTNLTEISQGLNLLWRNNIKPNKVILGLGFYGRSFTLTSSSCTTPGCAFSGGANPGECTQTSGILSNAEIQRIIKENSLSPVFDQEAGIKYIVWDSNQWVSYDDEQTYTLKKTFANKMCLGGTMVWALDLDDPTTSQSILNTKLDGLRVIGDNVDLNPDFAQKKLEATQSANNMGLLTFWTDCQADPQCPPGFKKLTEGHGKVFDSELGVYTADGCKGGPGGFNRALCIEASVDVPEGNCNWYGKGKACGQTCPPSQILISQNTHVGGASTGCKTGYYASFCCTNLYSNAVMDCAESAAGKAISGGLNLRVKSLAGLTEDLKGGGLNGPIGTLAECAADAYADGLAGELAALLGVAVAGNYIFNHIPGHWIYTTLRGWVFQPIRNLAYPQPNSAVCTSTVTNYVEETRVAGVRTALCDGNKYPQACYHYSSVSRDRPGLDTLVCPAVKKSGKYRPIVAAYKNQHVSQWYYWVSNFPAGLYDNTACSRDEYPPFAFLGGPNDYPNAPQPVNYDQWIRFLPDHQNTGAGQLWRGLCGNPDRRTSIEGGQINDKTCTEIRTITYRVSAMSMTFTNLPDDAEDGLFDNWCQVISEVRDDPGFALLTQDPWYAGQGSDYAHYTPDYKNSPALALTQGKNKPRRSPAKRWLERWQDHDINSSVKLSELIIDEGNTTRKATPKELWEKHQLVQCESLDCREEKLALGILPHNTAVPATDAVPTKEPESLAKGSMALSGTRPSKSMVLPTLTASYDSPAQTGTLKGKSNHRHRHAHRRHERRVT